MKMRQLEHFWKTLESNVGVAWIPAEWDEWLKSDYDFSKRYLRRTGKISDTYPCPKPGGEGCPRQVVRHAEGDIVAVCGDRPRQCDRIPLQADDIVLYEIDLRRLCEDITGALDLESSARFESDTAGNYYLGVCETGRDNHLPVHLALPESPEALRRAVTELMISVSRPFVLLTPVSHRGIVGTVELLRNSCAHYAVLDELLAVGEQGKLIATASLLDIVVLSTDPAAIETRNIFELEADIWTVSFGNQSNSFRHAKGFYYIAMLLASPGRAFEVAELFEAAARLTAGDDIVIPSGVGDAVASDDALKRIARRREQLREELRDSDSPKSQERLDKIRSELEDLEREHSRAVGLGGRRRKTGDPIEKWRKSVAEAIKRAIKKIDSKNSALAHHLDKFISRGRILSYTPATEIEWHVRYSGR